MFIKETTKEECICLGVDETVMKYIAWYTTHEKTKLQS